MTEPAPPLAGIRVVEVAAALSGPIAAMRLAELGADVIKVESLGGDMTRNINSSLPGMSPNYVNANAGKRSLALDLTTADGRLILNDLVDRSDVLVENWRDDRNGKLGFDLEAARSRNPGLIVGSVRGLHRGGQQATRTYDSHVQAVIGLAAEQSTADGEPDFIRLNLADRISAMALVQGVLAALFARASSGDGRRVTVSMAQAALAFSWGDLFNQITVTGVEPQSPRRNRIGMMACAADGWLCYTPVRNDEWSALCTLVGEPDFTARYPTRDTRQSHSRVIAAAFQPWFAARDRAEAVRELLGVGVPCAPVNRPIEVLTDPWLQDDILVGLREYEGMGTLREVGPMSADGSATSRRSAPTLGQHTNEVLTELGYSRARIDALRADQVIC
jgi:crotonobetainyl-CoA:carnitine CoA-transferase CaiB-like acyl-CoA transferase